MTITQKTSEQLKQMVKEKYGQIADQNKGQNETSCCGATGCSTIDYTVMADDYSNLKGYLADADLGLGCGLPTEFAQIKEGDTVVDLGSGAGNDCFIARSITGENGKVIGIDFTEKMIAKAKINADKLNFKNVEFCQGDIENMPLAANVADVVVSNCVLNLVPNKKQAFAETFRVLKKGGHFSVSDIVLIGELPEGLQKSAEMYAGCVSGAIQKEEYLSIIQEAGFTNIIVQKEKRITLPNEILKDYLSSEQMNEFTNGSTGIFSVTVFAEKPENCCAPAVAIKIAKDLPTKFEKLNRMKGILILLTLSAVTMSHTKEKKASIYLPIVDNIKNFENEFDQIPEERKEALKELASFVESKIKNDKKAELIFICTHNSRRSHVAQLWAQTAAAYYKVHNVIAYSGGTEATAFNPRAVKAMEEVGFKIVKTTDGTNPIYEVRFADDGIVVKAFSKKYDGDGNPKIGFGAVMTCSHADQNCPLVQGAAMRISTPYDDPKEFDGTTQEAAKYKERVNEIGREIVYAFSLIKT